MTARYAALVGSIMLVLLLSGCGGASPEAPVVTTTTPAVEPADVVEEPEPEPEAEPELEAVELAGFQARSLVFANIEYTITAVRVSNQTLRSYAEGGEPVASPHRFYAYLDVTAVNRMTRTMSERLLPGHYRLHVGGQDLPAADELGFLSDLTGFIRANVGVDSFLAFEAPQAIDLSEALLQIGSPPDRIASLPLTGDVPDPAYPLEVELTGSAEGVGPTNPGAVVFTVLGATLSEDLPHEHATSPTGHRANDDELFLVIHVRAEKASGGPDLLGRNAFRLLVDGVPREPWDSASHPAGSAGSPTLAAGAAVDAWVAFLVPVDAAELALQVGRFDQSPGVIPLALPPLS